MWPAICVVLSSVLLLTACEEDKADLTPQFSAQPKSTSQVVYTLGIHPLHNPTQLLEAYGPLADYLSRHLDNATVRIEASKNYPSYDKKLANEAFHFALPNPFQTIKALKNNYQVISQVGNEAVFKGLILVRKDSNIRQVSQLHGKKIAYPAPTALAATMMPQQFLHENGLDLKQTQTLYVGSQESSILNTYYKTTDASATWPIPWRALQKTHPEIAQALRVNWETSTLPSNSLMVHTKKVPKSVKVQVQQLLVKLHANQEGQAVLAKMNIQRIYHADNNTYLPVHEFVKQFRQNIGNNALLAETHNDN